MNYGSRKAGRRVWILAAVTAIAVVATAASVWQQQNRYKTNHTPELLFPDLKAAVNDVAEIRIEDSAGGFTLRRVAEAADDSDYRWVVADRDDYPAEISLVRMAILGLAEMKTTEPKTALATLHYRLGLNLPDAAKGADNGAGVAVTLLDESGDIDAALLIGKRKGALDQPGAAPRGPVRQFVRRLDRDQSWLSDGAPLIDADPTRWLDHELMDVVRGRWRDATITGDGSGNDGFIASRETPATYSFTISDQTGKPVAGINPTEASAIGAALAFLKFDDVRRADALDWEGARKLVFRTFDGLIIHLEVMRDGDDSGGGVSDGGRGGVGVVRLEAAFDEALATEGATLTADLHENFRADLRTADDVTAEAAQINRIAKGWAYAVPEFKTRELLKTLPDMLPDAKAAPSRQNR